MSRRVLLLPASHGHGHAARQRVLARRLQALGAKILDAQGMPSRDFGVRLWNAKEAGRLSETLDALERETPRALDAWEDALAAARPDLVVTDPDPWPLAAAARSGVPALFVGSFTWLDLARVWDPEASMDWLAALHGGADACELPFSLGLRGIEPARRIRVPHLVEPRPDAPPVGEEARVQALLALGFGNPAAPSRIDASAPTDLWLPEDAWSRPTVGTDITIRAFAPPLDERLARCDVVLAKPSHGIVAECLAARRPMHLVPRPDGPEDALIQEALVRTGVATGSRPGEPATVPDREELRRMSERFARAGEWARCDPGPTVDAVLARL